MQVRVKTWIKIAELISVRIKEESCFSSFPPFKTLISCDQFPISMFSLGMSIGKKSYAIMKAWAKVFNAIQIIILHDTMWQLTQQNLYDQTIPNKGSQVIDSPASTFKGLKYKEIDMVNSYN